MVIKLKEGLVQAAIYIVLLLSFTSPLRAQSIINFERIPFSADDRIVAGFNGSTVQKVRMSTALFDNDTDIMTKARDIQLHFISQNWSTQLQPTSILADDYQALMDGISIERGPATDFILYKSYPGAAHARITLKKNSIWGYFKVKGLLYFIVPHPSTPGHHFIYSGENFTGDDVVFCDKFTPDEISILNLKRTLDTPTGSTECLQVRFAQAYDSGMVSRYGSSATLSQWGQSILNVVEGIYTDAFTVDVDFNLAVESFAPTITLDFNSSIYLNNFKNWANGNGFGTLDYDAANLWTSITFSDGVRGRARAIGGMCSDDRYTICSDWRGPTTVPPGTVDMAWYSVLQSHELGHLFGMYHNDDPAMSNIMEPNLDVLANEFSDVSKLYFESSLPSYTCLGTCQCIEIIQATPINCSNSGNTHDFEILVAHEASTGSFTVTGGGVQSTFNYTTSPQTIILADVNTNISMLIVEDDTDANCIDTAVVTLPPTPSFTYSVLSPPYCIGMVPGNQVITSTVSESYGTIEIELLGDAQSANQQAAQILDNNGNVVMDWPKGTFAANGTTIVTSDPLNLNDAPFTMIMSDSRGDGLGDGCTGSGNEGYEIRDGQGNIIRAFGALPKSTLVGCSGNDATSELTTVTPALNSSAAGQFSGPGISDPNISDGTANFDASGLSAGQHTILYEFDTENGCLTEEILVTIAPDCGCGDLSISVLLEGAYDSTQAEMHVALNQFHLLPGQDPTSSTSIGAMTLGTPTPIAQPYAIAPWNHNGTEGSTLGDPTTNPGSSPYPSEVTDWVLVSVREGDSLATSEIWQCAMTLNKTGIIPWPQSYCPCLNLEDNTNYYVLIEHRNHLPIMSPGILHTTSSSLAYDFTQNQSWILESSPGNFQGEGQKLIGTKYVMYAGNENQSIGIDARTIIDQSDDTSWKTNMGDRFEYLNSDFSLDGDTNAKDNALRINNDSIQTFIPF